MFRYISWQSRPHPSGASSISGPILGSNVAPVITSASTFNCAENATLSHALTANESVTWSIVGGADQARYEISGSTLRWASNGTKDFEAPDDTDTNNTYIVDVRATDTGGLFTDQTITGTVTDVGEWAAVTTQNTTSQGDPKTFSSYAIGAASASRVVVAVIGWGNAIGRTITSVTIGGVAATLVQASSAAGTANYIGVYYAVVPTGTTADVVIDWDASGSGGCFCKVFYGYPVSSTPLDSAVTSAASGGLITASNIQIGVGGVLIAVRSGSGGATAAFAWTGDDALLTETTSVNTVNSEVAWTFSTEATATDDFTCDPSGSSTNALIVASWA